MWASITKVSRWLAMGVLLAAVSVGAQEQTQQPAQEKPEVEEEKCSDFTPDKRPCTAMEELGYCLTTAMKSFDECVEGANYLRRVVCMGAYEVDFYMCYASFPLKLILK